MHLRAERESLRRRYNNSRECNARFSMVERSCVFLQRARKLSLRRRADKRRRCVTPRRCRRLCTRGAAQKDNRRARTGAEQPR